MIMNERAELAQEVINRAILSDKMELAEDVYNQFENITLERLNQLREELLNG